MNNYYNYACLEPSVGTQPLRCRGASVPVLVEIGLKNVTRSAFYHLKNVARLRPSLSDSVSETLIHCFISTRLDYCNAIKRPLKP